MPADDPLTVLAGSYYNTSLPGRGNPDWSTPLDEILELRAKLREIGYKGTLNIEREGAPNPQQRLADIRAGVELLERLRDA